MLYDAQASLLTDVQHVTAACKQRLLHKRNKSRQQGKGNIGLNCSGEAAAVYAYSALSG